MCEPVNSIYQLKCSIYISLVIIEDVDANRHSISNFCGYWITEGKLRSAHVG